MKKVIKKTMKQQGFSLLEVLLALLIFSVIGLATEGLVSSSIKYQEKVVTKTEQLEDIAEVALRMRSDFLQIINRSVELHDSTREAALVGSSSSIRFTKSAWENPLESKRPNYQRVTYVTSKNDLERAHSQWLDIADAEDVASKYFKNIKDVGFQYLNAQMEWVPSWDSENIGRLPRAIKVFFSTTGFTDVERVFEIPSFETEEAESTAEETSIETE